MRPWRPGALAVNFGLPLGGCGATAHSSSTPRVETSPLPHPSPTPVISPTALAPTSCSTSHLRACLANGPGAAGNVTCSRKFQNVSQVGWILFGNPGVSLVAGASGPQLGAAATFVNHSQSMTVTLQPGATVSANPEIGEAGNFPQNSCDEAPSVSLRVYPPGQTASFFIGQSGLRAHRDSGTRPLQVGPVTG